MDESEYELEQKQIAKHPEATAEDREAQKIIHRKRKQKRKKQADNEQWMSLC